MAMPPYPWQTDNWSQFLRLLDHLPHAMIFAGPPGLGAVQLAQAMAHYLVCLAPLDGMACYQCKGCALVNASTHPDIHVVQVEEGSKNIKIEQIRSLLKQLDHTAQQGGRKIIIIDPAEAMNINAANALLKNLEEPVANTHFILINHELSQLLPTLRSRCMIMKLSHPSGSVSQTWLEQRGIKDSAELLGLVNGAPLQLLDWMENGLLDQHRAVEQGLLQLLEHGESPLAISRSWLNFDLLAVINSIILQVEFALKNSWQAQADKPITAALQHVNPRDLYRFFDHLLEKKHSLIGPSNPNTELLLNEVLVHWVQLISIPNK